jgi:hypothetical protein
LTSPDGRPLGNGGLHKVRRGGQRTLTNNGEQSTCNCGAGNQAENDKSQDSASALTLSRTREDLKGIGRHGGPYCVVLPLAGRSWEGCCDKCIVGRFGEDSLELLQPFGDPWPIF